jgi:serine/threonine protein kinase
MGDEAGVMLTDRLRLERKLGEGGVGAVWVAENIGLGTRVAVKVLHKWLLARPDAAKRFVQEARAMGQFENPHIVKVYDSLLSTDGRPIIVMELLQGEDLKHRLERLGHLPLGEVVDIVTQICTALTEVHARGIIHRDIKPANVLLVATHHGIHVKVMDFGVAKDPAMAELALTKTSHFLGTPFYMSPEQLESPKHLDHRADLWSVAVTAYELLTGTRPFPGDSLIDVSIAIDARDFKPASTQRSDIPRSLDAFFQRAFAHHLSARHSNAIEMAGAIHAAVPQPVQNLPVAGDPNFAIKPTALDAPGLDALGGTMAMEQFDELASTVVQDNKTELMMPAIDEGLMATMADPALSSIPPSQVVPPSQMAPHSESYAPPPPPPPLSETSIRTPMTQVRWPYYALIVMAVFAIAAAISWWLFA